MAKKETSLVSLADLLQKKFQQEQELKDFESSLQEQALQKFNEETGKELSLEDFSKVNSLMNKEKKEHKEEIETKKEAINASLQKIYQSLPSCQSFMKEEKPGEFTLDFSKIAKVKYTPKAPFIFVCEDEETHDAIVEKVVETGDYSCLEVNQEKYFEMNQQRLSRFAEFGEEGDNLPGIYDRQGVIKEEVSIYKKRGK